MLISPRIVVAIICVLATSLLIWYTLYFNIIGDQNAHVPRYTDPTFCRWPPATPDDIRTAIGHYNITVCIKAQPQSLTVKSVSYYPIQSLFRNAAGDKWVSFKDIGECDRSIWKMPIYPNVYRTYPQDVPIKDIVKAIKSGSPVSEASFPLRHWNLML